MAWDTLSRQGRRNVANVVTGDQIEQVMGEPPLAEPIRVFVGLESAPTETEQVALAIAELRRTGAFDRALLMVISPTGTGYVNYVAVESAAYLSRGNLATGPTWTPAWSAASTTSASWRRWRLRPGGGCAM